MNNTDKNLSISPYDDEYIPYIIKWGRATNLIGIVLAYIPALVLLLIFDLKPPIGAVFAGFVMQASVSGVFWFVEPISYFPVLGIPATYMSFLSGNIGNLRLPASVAAQEAASVEAGTEQGTIIATLGVAVSMIVNIVVLTIGVVLGASVLSKLPPNVVTALNNILPALFGAMFGQQFISNPKIGTVAAILAGSMIMLGKLGLLSFLPGGYTYAIIIVAVFGSILIGKKMIKNNDKEA
nr:hypothetical protein [Sedimentibacter sp.]